MNANLDLQTSGNNSVQLHTVSSALPNELQRIGPFSSEPVYHPHREMPRQEGQPILEEYEREMRLFRAESQALIEDVRREFMLPSDESVLKFLHEHKTIAEILLNAVAPLKKSFGVDAIFSLRMPADDISSPTMYAVVQWPGAVGDVRRALQQFDDSWWLAHLPQAAGRLTFTYELV
jgi:hypothetical protein